MRVNRADIGSLKAPRRHPAGFLEVDGYLTRAGIFEYLNPDGTTRRELRPPDEVFKSSSLKSFARVPVTDNHPPTMLDAGNAAQYARGAVGDAVARDGDLVRAPISVIDAALIAKMEGGKTALSCGYTCDLEMKPGTWNGEPYDAVQSNIVGNHVAIVDTARAGEAARVRMDNADVGTPIAKEEIPEMEETIRIDGIEYKVSPQIAQAFAKAQAANAAALKSATAERDTATARADAAEDKAKSATARADAAEDPKRIAQLVAARASLLADARVHLGADARFDAADGAPLSEREIKARVLAKLAPTVKLDGKSDEYVSARYDAAREAAGASNSSLDTVREAAEVAQRTDAEQRTDGDAEEAARKRNADWSKNAWKTPASAAK
jgi:hypothetical protein